MGLDLHYFWSLTPKQYAKHCKAYLKKDEQNARLQDRLNYVLGKYIGFAVNNPKEYPQKPALDIVEEQKEQPPQTADDMEKIARLNTLFMGGVINDSRRVTSTDNG